MNTGYTWCMNTSDAEMPQWEKDLARDLALVDRLRSRRTVHDVAVAGGAPITSRGDTNDDRGFPYETSR